MTIQSQLSPDNTVLTIQISGRFDFTALQQFRETYENRTPKPTSYIIDLKGSDYIDSSALGMLLALRDYAGGDKADVRLTNCNMDVKKILVITKLDELFVLE